jgi:hypothetical protein
MLKQFVRTAFGAMGYTISRTGANRITPADVARVVNPAPREVAFPAEPPLRPNLFMDKYIAWENGSNEGHRAGAFPSSVLRRIENALPPHFGRSLETGCGKSTTLFSNLSDEHHVFTFDDRGMPGSSFDYFTKCPLSRPERVHTVFGPTQKTIGIHKHQMYDVVLIDGPHGYPYPELEYYALYPFLGHGAILIVDDVHLPTIGKMADFIADDDMFDLVALIETTALFRRTDAPTFDPLGDGWWEQSYNRRRVPASNDFHLGDRAPVDRFTALNDLNRR